MRASNDRDLPGLDRFGDDGWLADEDALVVVSNYLLCAPEQGDHSDVDHAEGLARAVLHELHESGFEVRRG